MESRVDSLEINCQQNLQTTLENKSNIDHNHNLLYSSIDHNHDSTYVSINNITNEITNNTQLQIIHNYK